MQATGAVSQVSQSKPGKIVAMKVGNSSCKLYTELTLKFTLNLPILCLALTNYPWVFEDMPGVAWQTQFTESSLCINPEQMSKILQYSVEVYMCILHWPYSWPEAI